MASRVNEIATGVGHLSVTIANVYFVGSPGAQWVLVDAAIPGKADTIREAAEARYGDTKPEAIVLTHGHYDHAGSAAELADHWGVPILAHPLEMPYLTGKSPYPPADPTSPGFMSFVSRFFSRTQGFNLGDRVRAIDGPEIPGMPGWEWFHTPGHAPGQVAFFRRADATLLAGDAFTTVNSESLFAIAVNKQQVCRPPMPVTYDWKAARESVRLLADLRPFTLACGHGAPMMGSKATMELASLARDFPIPRHGRYVKEPARTDETGIVWLPPKPSDPLPRVAAGVGVAAGAAAIVVARKKLSKS